MEKPDTKQDYENKESKEKIEILERKLKEQDHILNGYQAENERLYSELKRTKAFNAKELSKSEEEKKHLKLSLIQERLMLDTKPTKSRNTSTVKSDKITIVDSNKPTEDLANENLILQRDNALLKQKLEYYEKNQHQIEQDVKLIELKNLEMKKLQEKLKFIEMGKTAPEYIRELKRLKTQLKEMDLLVKRQKKNSNSPNSEVNLSLDYYEKRIESLEAHLKEKTLDFDRYKRMWEQKYFLISKLGSASGSEIERSLLDMENGYNQKIRQLEGKNQDLKNSILQLEVKVAEKQKEIFDLKHEFDNYLKRDNSNLNRSKTYEPENFRQSLLEDCGEKTGTKIDFEYLKEILHETEKVKIKLVNTENELRLRAKDHEFELEKLKNTWQNKLIEANQKHKIEIEKLIKLFTGSSENEFISNFDEDYETMSLFDDPVNSRLLKRANERFNSQNEAKLEKLIHLNRNLNDELVSLRDRCKYLEGMNSNFELKLFNLENEKRQYFTPQSKDYEKLNEKLKLIERKYEQREREIESILNKNNLTSLNGSFKSMNSFHQADDADSSLNELKMKNLINFYEVQLINKNKEIDRFRNELDIMLKLLHSLQNSSN